ncbi:hypothetical protein AB4144_53255 [Rhizobiaceae sp. 2RAB30]
MKHIPENGIFKPAPSRIEAKSDATTKAAQVILAGEEAARIAKTERLRAARLAQEATEGAVSVAKKKARKG